MAAQQWQRFRKFLVFDPKTNFSIDISRINFPDSFLASLEPKLQTAYSQMQALVSGAIANPDEKRMVGHYWLRNSGLAPSAEIRTAIDSTLSDIKSFAGQIHTGAIKPPRADKFRYLLVAGIGGSALGPQFVTQALGGTKDALKVFFFDNTDSDGMDKALEAVPELSQALCVVISKSGGTKETRNAQLILKAALEKAGLSFAAQAVAVTGEGSELDKTATSEKWLKRFPMWDWVGGRTSELSAVGLLPAALQGYDVDTILAGAAHMDQLTGTTQTASNPAALLAAMWYYVGGGKGTKDMVVLPYKDRLELFSRYLQQLVMESLGKEHDLQGKVVNQGIAVYGNKGSTDQHAYVQQLRDGLNNFFVTFIEVLRDDSGLSKPLGGRFSAAQLEVEKDVTSGDYLAGFFQGTRAALHDSNRESVTITVNEVSAFSVGMLIALFERSVGFYASLVGINAYHQPGVEAGKKAAADVLKVQAEVLAQLRSKKEAQSVDQICSAPGLADKHEVVFKTLRHLAANGRVELQPAANLFEDRYQAV
jgi:glucose-6-phosphate isomerase